MLCLVFSYYYYQVILCLCLTDCQAVSYNRNVAIQTPTLSIHTTVILSISACYGQSADHLKGNQTKKSRITGPVHRMEQSTHTQQLLTLFVILFVQNPCFKSCQNITIGAAILCPAVCICDMNKAEMCGKMIKYIMNQPFSALRWYGENHHGCTMWSSN